MREDCAVFGQKKEQAAAAVAAASEPGEVFSGLRGQILGLDPATVGLHPTADLPRVWGALLETGYDNGTATLVSLADGTTSLYTSTGFGIIGGGAHKPVVEATLVFLRTVEQALDAFVADDDASVPAVGAVAMRALTFDGRRVVRAAEDGLGHGRHPQSAIFHAGHAVITQLRLIDEARRG